MKPQTANTSCHLLRGGTATFGKDPLSSTAQRVPFKRVIRCIEFKLMVELGRVFTAYYCF